MSYGLHTGINITLVLKLFNIQFLPSNCISLLLNFSSLISSISKFPFSIYRTQATDRLQTILINQVNHEKSRSFTRCALSHAEFTRWRETLNGNINCRVFTTPTHGAPILAISSLLLFLSIRPSNESVHSFPNYSRLTLFLWFSRASSRE